MVEKYLIAGFVFEIDYNGDEAVKTKLSEYRVDEVKSTSVFKIKIEYSDSDIHVKEDGITMVSDGLYFYVTDTTDVLFYYDENISTVIVKIEFSKDYRQVNAVLYELKKKLGFEDSQLAYNILGTIFNYVAQMNNAFVFHSSSLCHQNSGIAFSAKSGTGKSTHTGLWLHQFDDTFVLNDDTPVIHVGEDDKLYISGTPWAGTTGINRNVTVPLRAIVFLERSKENSIELISSSEAINPLFEGIRAPLTIKMLSCVMDTFNKLLSDVPVYKLKCNMDPSAAILSQKIIYDNKNM